MYKRSYRLGRTPIWPIAYRYTVHGRWLSVWRKRLTEIAKECYVLYWINPRGNIQQNSSCTATYHPSQKLSKLDEEDMRDTAGKVSDVLLWTLSHGVANTGRPARKYLWQLSTDTGRSQEDLLGTMDDKDEWRERFREMRARGTSWR